MAFYQRVLAVCVFTVFLAVLFGTGSVRADSGASGPPVIVFAAASLKNALDDAAAAWHHETGQTIKVSYAASSALAKQIEAGAPAQIFISADEGWMNYAAAKGLIKPQSRFDLLGNQLVLAAPKDSKIVLDLKQGAGLAKALSGGRLAIGLVDSVPAGKYGKAALEKLGLWDSVASKLAQAESVRAALLLVSRGEAPLGIVYRTDAASDASVRIVAAFPADSHPPIVYPIALTETASSAAAAFVTYLGSAKAAPYFEKQGFTMLRGR